MTKLFCLIPLILCFSVFAQKSDGDREMNQPVEPFKIIGNVYYVGASDVTSYLITTPEGHILIDGGFEETVPQIRANVTKLGFKLEDIKILLINHAHYDHCGGLAEIKKLTKARLYASPPDASVLEDGGMSDFRFGGDKPLFTPVKPDEILKDGQEIRLGGSVLKTYFTFGHTKGATSWTTEVTENGRKFTVAFVSSLTTLDYALTNNPKYPQIAADFTKTFAALSRIKADVLLSSHGGFFDLTEKSAKIRAGAKPNPFIGAAEYQGFIKRMEKAFQDKLKAEKASKK
ncbi:MAG TPA: subclass B3 metallo-beta-lactamase [Pyrinomonadaceae bacterium]|nr:subclass B3 metallo-beta-lactamase [Pyrinomonadaceae bacterium]